MNLKNKVVVVTGGSAGLGEQICYEAAKQGAIVVTCARRQPFIEQVKARCRALSGNPAYAFQLDISDPDNVTQVADRILKEVGQVDVLVNNAGFGSFQEFLSFDLTLAQKMFEVNVLGMMFFTQKLAVPMVERKSGHILNIASMAGKMATPKSTVYSATKFAVLGFSNALRLELRPFNVHVTSVNPGPIATDFFDKADPTGRYLDSLGDIVLNPQKLAHEIVSKMGRPVREINRPRFMELGSRIYGLFPHLGDFFAANLFDNK